MDPMNHETTSFTAAELASRRRGARRLAWVLGGIVLVIYSAALWLPRF